MKKRIYLSPPHIGKLEKAYIDEAFRDNWIAPVGPHIDAFEKELAQYVGVKGAVALSSGTAALHLALRLLGVEQGDVVFCSTFTFIASANPILYQGAHPVFIDSEPNSWNMSPQALERAFIDSKKNGKLPKAVIIVSLYGQSADMDPLLSICERYGVPVIEDAAESLGATYKGKACGTFGDFGVYSFNGNKIITTSGGGALVSNDTEALNKARFWATQARDQARHYQHSDMGYNYRLSNVLAGIGRGQLQVLDERIRARRRIYDRYVRLLGDVPGFSFMPEMEGSYSTRWLTVVSIDPQQSGIHAVELVDMLEKNNIEARMVWKPLHLQPLFKKCLYYSHKEGYSVSDHLFATGVCLPSGSKLEEEDIQRISACIRDML
jgi:pyridoxal phosphate-dependent aminotransferase EpsN